MQRNTKINQSKGHHYIPQFYLRCFTDDNGGYYLFDKKTRKIRYSTPANSFKENGRNTTLVDGKKDVHLENIYTHYDTEAALYFNQLAKIFKDKEELIIDNKAIGIIKFFILCLHFRTPRADYAVEKLIDNLSFKECGLYGFIQELSGDIIITPEIEGKLKKIEGIRKLYKLFIPFSITQSKYWEYDSQNWKIYSLTDTSNNSQLTSDNPVILRHPVYSLQTGKELILPISSDRLLINTSFFNPSKLNKEFTVYKDLLILHQSYRFVCCANKEYLEELIGAWETDCLPDPNFEKEVKESIFSFLGEKNIS